jgi:Cu(I)/Ag(I) efflux system membrane fusion protein
MRKRRYSRLFAGAVLWVLLLALPAAGGPQGDPPPDAAGGGRTAAADEGLPGGGDVEIPLDWQRRIGVRTVAAAIRPSIRTIRTVGRVEFDERRVTTVNIKYEGWVERLHADYAGKPVKKGEPLAEIWSPEATSVQLEYLNLLKWKGEVPRFQRTIEFEWGDRYGTVGRFITYDPELLVSVARQKFKLWGFTDNDIKEIERRQEPFERITVKSPESGYVFQKPAFRGTRVAPGDKLFDIVDLSSVWVLADIYEYEIPLVAPGQPARITLSQLPGQTFDAAVDFVYPALAGRSRTAKARFVLPNPGLLIKPQMFATVEIAADLGPRLTIPADACLDTGARQVVYVDMGEGVFQPRRVRTGLRSDQGVEVLEGLKPGERVAWRPVFLIDSEAKLKGVAP